MRVDAAAADPEPAPLVPVHLDRLDHNRVGREVIDLEAVRKFKRFQLSLHIRRRDVLQVTLRACRSCQQRKRGAGVAQQRPAGIESELLPAGPGPDCKKQSWLQTVPFPQPGASATGCWAEGGADFDSSFGRGFRSSRIFSSCMRIRGRNSSSSPALLPCSYSRNPRRYVSF